MRRGLVFGKFMPLHRGHQLLIDSALAECDDLTIVVYDSHPTGQYERIPLELRLRWLRDLYPQAENIVSLPDIVSEGDGDDPAFAGAYAEQVRFLGPFDRVFSSEPSYEKFATLLGAEHVVVDFDRMLVPTSGTTIRSNLYEFRGWMDPLVYSSLIQKVVFVGTESSGKTTLARRMAEEYETLWVHEFGRELWVSQGLQGSFADHVKMADRQYQREEAMARHARRFLFCDTNAWTTLQWCLRSYGCADVRLHDLVDRTMRDYIWFMCENDFGWVQDGIRELEGGMADEFQTRQILDLRARQIGFYYVGGSVDERVRQVSSIISQLSPTLYVPF